MTIRKLQVIDDKVIIEGVVSQAAQLKVFENSMRGIARGNVRAQLGAALPDQAGVQFSIRFDVDRNLMAAR